MLVRVARWEGAKAAALEQSAAAIRSESESGPPPGVPAKRFLLLQDPAAGKAIALTMFETEEDYAEGDATLNAMSPPGEDMGRRVDVGKFELVVDLDA